MLDHTSFTLTPNEASPNVTLSAFHSSNASPTGGRIAVNDPRWKFPNEAHLPPPRNYHGSAKKYRAGRGSTVPLDLGALGT